MKTKTISIEKKLTEAEINERAHELSSEVHNKNNKISEKKSIMSMFNADINALDEKITKLSQVINQGFIFEDTECTYEDDFVLRIRTYRNAATGVVAKVEPIPMQDDQDALPFDDEEDEA